MVPDMRMAVTLTPKGMMTVSNIPVTHRCSKRSGDSVKVSLVDIPLFTLHAPEVSLSHVTRHTHCKEMAT